jgi:hypothetical protein
LPGDAAPMRLSKSSEEATQSTGISSNIDSAPPE